MLSVVEVAVGLPVRGTYSYALPPALEESARVGTRVLVPFGPRGVTGVIVGTPGEGPEGGLRLVREVLDDRPALEPSLVELCLWIAEYYEAPPGEVLRAALPPGTAEAFHVRLALSAGGRAFLEGRGGALPAPARQALASLAVGKAPRLPVALRRELLDRGLVEEVDERQRARVSEHREPWAFLARPPTEDEARALARAPRRAALLAALAGGPRPARELAGAGSRGDALRALIRMGLVATEPRPPARPPPALLETPLAPTPGQALALDAIGAALDARRFEAFLLHGVTGSGKTEVYLQSIARARAAGRGALVLVPEIALTPQLAARFRARFGDEVVVLHSGLGDAERLRGWRRLRAGEAHIAVGARSAVFAPVGDLGIVVVDEEHDPSFKQEEGVRYHARDVALVRARRAGAVCVLGSATPSLESYQGARAGRLRLVELPARAQARPLPEVELVDLRVYQPDAETLLTAPLAGALSETLAAGEQAILFLNRRGFATFVVCCACGHAFRCPRCSVSLTYHRAGDRLRCHYCAHRERVPEACPKCHAAESIKRFGLGTERIEAAIADRYPQARVARLDRDTAAGRGLEDVLGRFARREVDVLVGTQMVTKGHDFPGVTLVGVLLADGALSLPDFRAAERTFQLLTQVAGRAGRGDRRGRVVVQTFSPTHHAVSCAQTHDYAGFFAAESAARAELGYPPHGRLVAIRLDGPREDDVRAAARLLATRAATLAGDVGVLGPAEAPLARLKGRTRWHVWLKHADRPTLRAFARRLVADLEVPREVRVTVDVDPMSAM
jgi:primosomal protein N' (replication factor Y)